MIRGLNSQVQMFLTNMDRINTRLQNAQQQLSSGLRISKPSDAPDEVMNILRLRSEVARATTVGANLDRATTEVDTAEATIRVAVQLVERARVLAAQGASDTATNRSAMAIEVDEILEQLVNLTYTSAEGRLIFSGDNDQERLYQYQADPEGNPGTVEGPPTPVNNTREIEDVNGARFMIGKTAADIFDAPEGKVFDAVHKLAVALKADNAGDVEAATGLLNKAVEHLGRITTFYGNAQNRVRDAVSLSKSTLIALHKELGLSQDADIAQAAIELTLASVHQNAALNAQSKMPRTSLFDFLA